MGRAWTIGLGMIIATAGAGCTDLPARSGAGMEPDPSHVEIEKTVGKLVVDLAADGATIEVKATLPVKCREVAYIRLDRGTSKREGDWKACGKKPAARLDVVVILADGTKLDGKTDATGAARIDLGEVLPSNELIKKPQAIVLVGRRQVGTVDLRETSAYASWRRDMEQEQAAAQVAAAAAKRVADEKREHDQEAQRQADAEMAKKTSGWPKMSRTELRRAFTAYVTTAGRVGDVTGNVGTSAARMTFALSSCGLGAVAGNVDCSTLIQAAFPDDVFCLSQEDECRVSPKMIAAFRAAERAKPAIERAEHAQCVQKCLVSAVNATRDHCEATCP